MQLVPAGESTAALRAWDQKAPGKLSGSVKAAGKAVKEPVVVVEQNGEMLAWAQGKDGKFAFTLPSGDYDLYATGKGYLPGGKVHVTVSPQKPVAVNFTDLKAPGSVTFKIVDEKGQPQPARITIEKGSQPAVRFLGARTFFTELAKPGELAVELAPGDYTFKVNSGWPFLTKASDVSVSVPGGKNVSVPVSVPTLFDPAAKGWVSLDMHHHSDLLDGVTPPEYLVRSQVAGRLDYLFLSDHDTMDNLKKVDALAKKYGFRFVPALEISPSWAHFNAMPMPLDKPFPINPATATASEIFKAARDLGAQIIVANHPMIVYGYLTSLDTGKIPGGFDPGFDNFEINSDGKFMQAIPRVWDYWTKGQFYPYTAGTDIHDVWNYVSGRNRLFVFMDKNDLNDQQTLFKQIKAGRAYASMGPLVFPEIMFGSKLKHKNGEELALKYDLAAVDGLKEVLLISEGKTLESKSLNNESQATVSFTVKPEKNTWYAITVKDAADHHAWTNPVFVEVQ